MITRSRRRQLPEEQQKKCIAENCDFFASNNFYLCSQHQGQANLPTPLRVHELMHTLHIADCSKERFDQIVNAAKMGSHYATQKELIQFVVNVWKSDVFCMLSAEQATQLMSVMVQTVVPINDHDLEWTSHTLMLMCYEPWNIAKENSFLNYSFCYHGFMGEHLRNIECDILRFRRRLNRLVKSVSEEHYRESIFQMY